MRTLAASAALPLFGVTLALKPVARSPLFYAPLLLFALTGCPVGLLTPVNQYKGSETVDLPPHSGDFLDVAERTGKSLGYSVTSKDAAARTITFEHKEGMVEQLSIGKIDRTIIVLIEGGGQATLTYQMFGNLGEGGQDSAATVVKEFTERLFEQMGSTASAADAAIHAASSTDQSAPGQRGLLVAGGALRQIWSSDGGGDPRVVAELKPSDNNAAQKCYAGAFTASEKWSCRWSNPETGHRGWIKAGSDHIKDGLTCRDMKHAWGSSVEVSWTTCKETTRTGFRWVPILESRKVMAKVESD